MRELVGEDERDLLVEDLVLPEHLAAIGLIRAGGGADLDVVGSTRCPAIWERRPTARVAVAR